MVKRLRFTLPVLAVFLCLGFSIPANAGPAPKECVPVNKTFYQTTTAHNGWDAATACAAGFHVPTAWELSFFEGYEYDFLLGEQGSQPNTPPLNSGWIFNYCDASDEWAQSFAGGFGKETYLDLFKWELGFVTCNIQLKVWCFSDPLD